MTTKHKWANEIHAWADGAQIQYFDRFDKSWRDIVGNGPTWGECNEYRVKPEPEAEWKQKLRQAAREGKRIEYLDHKGEWVDCLINSVNPDAWDFFGSIEDDYRIVPKTVTRWKWAYISGLDWYEVSRFMTEDEAKMRGIVGLQKLEYTKTEFPE